MEKLNMITWIALILIAAWLFSVEASLWKIARTLDKLANRLTDQLTDQLTEQIRQNSLTPLQRAANRVSEREEEDERRANSWWNLFREAYLKLLQ